MTDISGLTWTLTIVLILALLAVDLVLAAVRPHRVGFREATAWSIFYIALAIGFGIWFTTEYGGGPGTEYFAGYVVEKSLSVDNLFVFALIFGYFKVPREYQHRVLFYGVIGALVFRGIFLAAGVAIVKIGRAHV